MLRFVQYLFFSFVFGLALMLPATSFAQSDPCEDYEAVIQWSSEFKAWKNVQFSTALVDVRDNSTMALDDQIPGATISYRIFFEGKIVERSDSAVLNYAFDEVGVYEISTTVVADTCTFVDTLTVRTYKDVYFYFWEFVQDFNQGLVQNIQQHDILFSPFIMEADVENILDEELLADLENKYTDIEHSQVVFFNVANFSNVFSLLDWLQNEQAISFSQKDVVLISQIDPSLLKKFLAPFVKEHEVDLYVVNMDELRDMFYFLSVGETDSVSTYLTTPISFGAGSLNYSISRFVDAMIFNGFSVDFVAMALVLSFAVMLLVFARQVIGIWVFGLYYPLLFAIVFAILGESVTLIFFVLAFFAHLLAIFIQQRVNLLVHAKMGLYLILYIFSTIVLLWLVTMVLDFQRSFGSIQDVVFVLGFLSVPVFAKKVFLGEKKILSLKQLTQALLFLWVSYALSLMLLSVGLQHWLLVRPGILVVFLFWVILFGRFTGLQIMEYIRFWPLIKEQLMADKPKKIKSK